jgi:hypothetical protein
MTRNKAVDALQYSFTDGDQVLVDANVWLYLFPPPANPVRQEKSLYSSVLKNMLSAKVRPKLDAYILSEYINAYLRIEFKASTFAQNAFKTFRQSSDGIAAVSTAVAEARTILQFSEVVDTELSNATAAVSLTEILKGGLDFNDAVLTNSCSIKSWTLLTNDADMVDGGINVLTCNKRLLSACP